MLQTDYSRFDGTISPAMREFEKRVLMRAFHRSYLQRAADLHKSQQSLKAVCRLDTVYQSGTARASGSPETAVFNSIDNAFTIYVAWRESDKTMTPKAAFEKMSQGIYGGDDGITPDLSGEVFESVATRWGLRVKIVKAEKATQDPVTFLARYYGPDVWQGDAVSMCDLNRQLAKFHLCIPRPANVAASDILVEKSIGYMYSDRHTPVIGQLVSKVEELKRDKVYEVYKSKKNLEWSALRALEGAYPNEPRDWMKQLAQQSLVGFNFVAFDAWIEGVSCVEDILACPTFNEFQLPRPVDVPVTFVDITVPAEVKDLPLATAVVAPQNPRKRKTAARKWQRKPTNEIQLDWHQKEIGHSGNIADTRVKPKRTRTHRNKKMQQLVVTDHLSGTSSLGVTEPAPVRPSVSVPTLEDYDRPLRVARGRVVAFDDPDDDGAGVGPCWQ